MTVTVGRVTVITSDPNVLPVLPFVVPGNPNRSTVRSLPLLIILTRRRGRLVANMDHERLGAGRESGRKTSNRR